MIQIARAQAAGVERIVVATAYRPEVLEEYFGDGARFGLDIEYMIEPVPLGTGGSLRSAAGRLTGAPDDPVLILNSDVLSDADLTVLVGARVWPGAVLADLAVRFSSDRGDTDDT